MEKVDKRSYRQLHSVSLKFTVTYLQVKPSLEVI